MCNFKSALLIPRFPSTDGFDIFYRDGVDSHTTLMELANINPNDTKINVAKLELVPKCNPSDISQWEFILDELRRPDWLDDSMLADSEFEMRRICSRYITKDGEYTILDKENCKHWYLNWRLHREDGPAMERSNGDKFWYLNGELHRKDGPAMEFADGDKHWCMYGRLHRTDGPAIESANGKKEWHINGKRHRTDGPAVEYPNGTNEWWLDGKRISEKEFNELSDIFHF